MACATDTTTENELLYNIEFFGGHSVSIIKLRSLYCNYSINKKKDNLYWLTFLVHFKGLFIELLSVQNNLIHISLVYINVSQSNQQRMLSGA